MMQKISVVGAFQCNCILLGCEKTKEAVLIDPGDEPQKIIKMVEETGMRVKYLLHTHAHLDHVGATKGLFDYSQAITCLHKDDLSLYENVPNQARYFGLEMDTPPTIQKFISHEETVHFGEEKLKVIHTPGHSPGSICFQLQNSEQTIYSGDTLFYGSVGRSDLWGGDHSLLVKSIKERLLNLEDEILVFPGHGPKTSIGFEKRQNPFLL